MRWLIIIALFFDMTLAVAKLRFVSVDFPPYTYQTPTGGAGAMYDVVKEIGKRLGQPADIHFVPWARARLETENNPNMGIIPLARTPEREDKYKWIIHILDDPYVLVALKDSKFNIADLEAAKKLNVGVLAGSAAEPLLQRLGFQHVEAASTDVQNVTKLKLGRLDAWVAPYSCRGQYREGGLGNEDLRTGAVLTMLHEYLGGSKTLDDALVNKWRQEFNKMKKDGSYAAIMKKYDIKPLP